MEAIILYSELAALCSIVAFWLVCEDNRKRRLDKRKKNFAYISVAISSILLAALIITPAGLDLTTQLLRTHAAFHFALITALVVSILCYQSMPQRSIFKRANIAPFLMLCALFETICLGCLLSVSVLTFLVIYAVLGIICLGCLLFLFKLNFF